MKTVTLIDTRTAIPGKTLGTVISSHWSIASAFKANDEWQKSAALKLDGEEHSRIREPMNETEDEFVRYTRQQRQDLRLDKSTFDKKRCREIYRRTRREIAALDTSRLPPTSFVVGEQLPLFP